MGKIFRLAMRMMVVMEVYGEPDEDGGVIITDVRSVDLPSAGEVMDGLTVEDCEEIDRAYAEAG